MKKNRGITLIALVITIIVLLILAGITILLTVGENSIIGRARQASQATKESSIREKLILKIGDLQTQKLVDEQRIAVLEDLKEFMKNDSQHYSKDVEKVEIKEKTAEVTIDNYTYTIDENLNIIIEGNENGGNNNQGQGGQNSTSERIEDFTPTISYNNGTYLTIDASTAKTTDGTEIVGFLYLVNDEVIENSKQNTANITNLDLNTEYQIRVIAIDKNGKFKNSSTIMHKTSQRQYIYQNGNEYTEVTGGWVVGATANKGTGAKYADKMYINCPAETSKYTTYTFRTANKIPLSKFKTLHIVWEVTNYAHNGGGIQISSGLFNNEYSYYSGNQASDVINAYNIKAQEKRSKEEVIVEVPNVSELYPYLFIGAGGLGDYGTMYVYEMWFE